MNLHISSFQLSIIFCVLFYQQNSVFVSGVPISSHDQHGGMPAMAQKAGGSYRSGYVGRYPVKVEQTESKASSATSQAMPAVAQKAGGSWKPEVVEDDAGKSKDSESTEYDANEWGDSSSEEEKDCSGESFYHIRSKQCVPLECYGGKEWRDAETGECAPEWFVKALRSHGHMNFYGSRNYWGGGSTALLNGQQGGGLRMGFIRMRSGGKSGKGKGGGKKG